MEFRVLGGLDVRHGDKRLDVGAAKQRTVLAALLLSANEAVSTHRLTDFVWWDPPAAANSNLRVYLTGLRRALRPPGEADSRLRTVRASGYQLQVRPGELDLDQFNELAGHGDYLLRTGQLPAAADRLDQALRLWRGRPLDSVPGGRALQATVTYLEERRLAVAERWAQVRLHLGWPGDVVVQLRALAREHPLRERLWGQLMVALCRCGRPAEALATYAELRRILSAELGTDPSLELRRLHECILRGEDLVAPGETDPITIAGPAETAATQPAGTTTPRQLPAATSRLYGRRVELAGC